MNALKFQTHDSRSLSLENRLDLVRQFGNFTLAYSTAVQPDLLYFGDRQGYVAYKQRMGYTIALGDPVTAPQRREQLIDAFVAEFSKPSFLQVSSSTADILSARRFYVNEMGYDTRLNLDEYDFRGKEKERFRYAANWLLKRGYRIEELEFGDAAGKGYVDGSLGEQLAELVQVWRATRVVSREVVFLNRPIVYENETDVRRFFLIDPDGRIAAFVFFDPLFEAGQIVGYVTSFKRRHPDAPGIAETGITKVAIEKFKQEGIQRVMLGLAPLAGIENKEYRCNRVLHHSFRWGLHSRLTNRWIYNLKGHAEFKDRYRGVCEQTYYASPVFMNDLRMLAILRLLKVF